MKNDFYTIDLNELDINLVMQPKLMYKYSLRLAKARVEYDKVKNALEVVEAEIDLDIRESPDKYTTSKKITETHIKNLINTNEKRIEAFKKVLKAKSNMDILYASVTALEHKKSALEKLVVLYGQSYFAKVSTTTPEMQEIVKEHNDKKIIEKLNESKK
jgi:hypothetical protein